MTFRGKVRDAIAAEMAASGSPLEEIVRVHVTPEDRAGANTDDRRKQNEWLIGEARRSQLFAGRPFGCSFENGDAVMVIRPNAPDTLI